MDAQDLRRKFKFYYLGGMLLLVGIGVLYGIFALPTAQDYPRLLVASGALSLFAVLSGIGILARKAWVRWSLLLLLLSMYAVFATTHNATGEASQIVFIAAFVLLPVAAFLFWRVVKKFVFEEQ
jgi:hypothetical protein